MSFTAYIDGQYGTTGLQIHERLGAHPDIEVLSIDQERKKDPELRKEFLNKADVVFLCLPDDASRQAVALIDGVNMKDYHKNPEKYSIYNKDHKRYKQYEPFLLKREKNRLDAYVANRKLKRTSWSEQVDQNRDQLVEYVKNNPAKAEHEFEKIEANLGVGMPDNLKYILK